MAAAFGPIEYIDGRGHGLKRLQTGWGDAGNRLLTLLLLESVKVSENED